MNNHKMVTQYVVLKVTYNSFYCEPPITWDWNTLAESGPNENVEVVRVSDIPIPSSMF